MTPNLLSKQRKKELTFEIQYHILMALMWWVLWSGLVFGAGILSPDPVTWWLVAIALPLFGLFELFHFGIRWLWPR